MTASKTGDYVKRNNWPWATCGNVKRIASSLQTLHCKTINQQPTMSDWEPLETIIFGLPGCSNQNNISICRRHGDTDHERWGHTILQCMYQSDEWQLVDLWALMPAPQMLHTSLPDCQLYHPPDIGTRDITSVRAFPCTVLSTPH
jgi:hypothetical protein